MVTIHSLRGFNSALIRLSYIGAVWRKAWGSNPYDVSVITVFKTDKHASLAAFLIRDFAVSGLSPPSIEYGSGGPASVGSTVKLAPSERIELP